MKAKPDDSLLIYSGGLDSTVLLYKLLNEGSEVTTISFDYGQRHICELTAVVALKARNSVHGPIVHLGHELFLGSSQTSPEISVPEGHYAAASMKATVVPNRNMVMISLATACALSLNIPDLYYAAHSGDHAIYPDCRPEFVTAMQAAIKIGNDPAPHLHAPFILMSKAEIVALGSSLNVPFELTWSCYKGASIHCGLCGTCMERREAFSLAGVSDPTLYKTRG